MSWQRYDGASHIGEAWGTPCWRAERGRRTAQHGGGVVRALAAVQAVQLVRQPAHEGQLDLLLHEAQAAVDDRGRDRHPCERRQACPPRTPFLVRQGATACMAATSRRHSLSRRLVLARPPLWRLCAWQCRAVAHLLQSG